VNAHTPAPQLQEAFEALMRLDPTGYHHLTSMSPESGGIEGKLFAPGPGLRSELDAWVGEQTARRRNVYYSVNEPIPEAPATKLTKAHIARIRAIGGDVDPRLPDGAPLEDTPEADATRRALMLEARNAVLEQAAKIADGPFPPSITLDSGNGAQFVWILAEKLDPANYRIDAEEQGRGIAAVIGGDAVGNIDRVLRLPGTINFPSESKRRAGKVGGPVRLLSVRDDRYTIDQLDEPYPGISSGDSSDRNVRVQAAIDELDFDTALATEPTDPLIVGLRERTKTDVELRNTLAGTRKPPGDGTGSAWRSALAAAMAKRGYDVNDYAAVVTHWPLGKPSQGDFTARMIARDWGNVAQGHVEKAEATKAMFEDTSGAEIDTSAFKDRDQQVGDFDTYDLLASTAPAPRPTIELIDPADWYGREPNLKEWYVEAFVPRGEVTMLTGKGGVGKSLLALQLLIAVALGIPFLGLKTRRAKCLGFFCEDDPDVLHARVRDICRSLGRDERELSGWLFLVSRKYDDNLLCTFDRNGSGVVLKATPLFEELVRVVKELGVELSCLDTIADIFGGDEINRQQVRQFVQGCAGRLAAETGGACLMLGHPSRAGEQNGEGTSGSTAWHGSVRSRFYLDHIGDEGGLYRELTTKKSNYGPAGAKWKLMWKAGVLEVVTASRSVSEGAPEIAGTLHRIVLDAVAGANRDSVRITLGKTSKHKAEPILRRRETGALAPYTAAEVEEALQQLVAIGAVVEAEVARDGSRRPIMGLKAVAEASDEPDISSDEGGFFD
jgi:hypothetical protein